LQTLAAKISCFVLAGAVFGCSRQAVVVHERLPDGSYSFKCEDELWVCLSYVQRVCKGAPYVVHDAWDEPETSGVEQYRVETHRSRAHVRCVRPGSLAKAMAPAKAPVQAPVAAHAVPGQSKAPSAPPPAPKPARVCVPGATQSCVGPAACSGGQACLSDGSGFGPCDCGTR
jgi:hypothetical protein